MESVDVVLVALPHDRPAVGAELEAGEHVDRTRRRVVAGNPLRIQQGQRTGLDRHAFMHAEDALRGIAGIHMQRHGAGVFAVLRRGHIVGARLLGDRNTCAECARDGQGKPRKPATHSNRRRGGRGAGHERLRWANGRWRNLASPARGIASAMRWLDFIAAMIYRTFPIRATDTGATACSFTWSGSRPGVRYLQRRAAICRSAPGAQPADEAPTHRLGTGQKVTTPVIVSSCCEGFPSAIDALQPAADPYAGVCFCKSPVS